MGKWYKAKRAINAFAWIDELRAAQRFGRWRRTFSGPVASTSLHRITADTAR